MRCAAAFAVLSALHILGAEAAIAQDSTARDARAVMTQTERMLRGLEDEWTRALVRRDAGAFRRLLVPEFVYTENERVMTRDELIREITTGTDTVQWAANEDMRVYAYGQAAVVTGILHLRGRGKDGPFERRFRYTDTWVSQNGEWKVVAAHDFLLPQ